MGIRRDRSKTIGKVSELTIATPIKRGLVEGELRPVGKRLEAMDLEAF